MKILKFQKPPNYDEIVKAFPDAAKPTVIFAYGDVIYNPGGSTISTHLLVHESVHGVRQREMGVEEWWDKYLTDVEFRYYEELVAHVAEYISMSRGTNRHQRRAALKVTARRLCSPLYNAGRTYKEVCQDILAGVKHDDSFLDG